MDDGVDTSLITGGVLTANAAGAITIDTTVESATLSSSADGNIDVDQTDKITLTKLSTTNGTITVDAGGEITATDIASGSNRAIKLSTTSGDITAIKTVNAGTGSVDLTSAGAIVDDGVDASLITGGVLSADATGAITIDTTVTSATLSSSLAGNIDVDETDGIILTKLKTANGTITVNAGGEMTATDVQTSTNNDITLTTIGGDINGVGIISTGSGNVKIDSAGSVIDDGDSGTVISANNLEIKTAVDGTVKIDTSITSANIDTNDADIDETDDIILAKIDVTILDLESGGSVTDSGSDGDGSRSVSAPQSAKVVAGNNVVLNDSENELGKLDITAGDKAIIRENDLVNGIVKAKSLQVQGTTGITLGDGTSVSSFAAKSDSGDIDLDNTGGLAINSFSSDPDLALDGVLISGTTTKSNIDLKTKSPIAVNAPISNATKGQIILAALGKEATDDITINSSITGDDLIVYAGDSILLTSAAEIKIVDEGNLYSESSTSSNYDLTGIRAGNTKLYYGTDFTSGNIAQGNVGADVHIAADSAILDTVVEVANSVRTEYIFDGVSNRLTYGTPEQIQDAYNLSDPNIESLDIWSSMNYGNVIMTNDHYELEDEEEANITILKVRE